MRLRGDTGQIRTCSGQVHDLSPLEKFYWCNIVIYLCCFLAIAVTGAFERLLFYELPFHFLGMAMGIPMLIILFHDLYKRHFPNPNSKVTWTILMLMFWPSIPVYLYKYGFRARQQAMQV
ncbi:MAG: hypothetical protein ACYC0X_26435 [Pirellulaceae bacterium]